MSFDANIASDLRAALLVMLHARQLEQPWEGRTFRALLLEMIASLRSVGHPIAAMTMQQHLDALEELDRRLRVAKSAQPAHELLGPVLMFPLAGATCHVWRRFADDPIEIVGTTLCGLDSQGWTVEPASSFQVERVNCVRCRAAFRWLGKDPE